MLLCADEAVGYGWGNEMEVTDAAAAAAAVDVDERHAHGCQSSVLSLSFVDCLRAAKLPSTDDSHGPLDDSDSDSD